MLDLAARAFSFGHRSRQIEEASHAVGQAAALDGDRAHIAGLNQYFHVGHKPASPLAQSVGIEADSRWGWRSIEYSLDGLIRHAGEVKTPLAGKPNRHGSVRRPRKRNASRGGWNWRRNHGLAGVLSQNLKPLCLLETPNAGLLPTLTLALVLATQLHVANSRAPVASVAVKPSFCISRDCLSNSAAVVDFEKRPPNCRKKSPLLVIDRII